MISTNQNNLAILVGINAYGNGIPSLKTPVNDVAGLAEVLKSSYQYDIKLLLDSEATLEGINCLLDNLKRGILTLSDNRVVKLESYNRVLFYFAGHGIVDDAFENKDGPAGYLIPQDANKDDKTTFLRMQHLHDVLVELKCRHLLVILDCCFAGAFRFLRHLCPPQKLLYREQYDRFMKGKAQQLIASASYDEKALDVVTRFGQREGENTGKNSPFAEVLIKALQIDVEKIHNGGVKAPADIIPDGVITASELYIYLEKELSEITNRQTPGIYPLKHHQKGEYIFQVPGFVPDSLRKALPLDEKTNPYRGLEPYQVKDSELFFGREPVIRDLVEQVSDATKPPLTVVLGVSGSGKSSLVKAGLIPRLLKEKKEDWTIFEPIRPRDLWSKAVLSKSETKEKDNQKQQNASSKELQPMGASPSGTNNRSGSILLPRMTESEPAEITESKPAEITESKPAEIIKSEQDARTTNLTTWNASQQIPQLLLEKLSIVRDSSSSATSKKLLLVIDQFEELVTQSSQQEKEQFVQWLQQLLTNHAEEIQVVITLRSEFEAQFASELLSGGKEVVLFAITLIANERLYKLIPILAQIYQSWPQKQWMAARFVVPAMTQDEFRDVIEKPAAEKVLYFDPPELVDKLINEVLGMPGALPLLSFTLSELYLKYSKRLSDNRAMTQEDYELLGGVMGSLKTSATRVYDQLVKEDSSYEQTIRHVMLRMVAVGGGRLARRAVPAFELKYPKATKNDQAKKIIDKFIEARLIVSKTYDKKIVYYEPAHDALILGWDKLLKWRQDKKEQENLLLQRQLIPAVEDWKKIKQSLNQAEPFLDLLDKGIDLFHNRLIAIKALLSRLWRQNSQEQEQKEQKKSKFLWDTNPRLNLLEEVLNSSDNWLSKTETEFVESSIKQHRRKTARDSTLVIGILLGLSCLPFYALYNLRNFQIEQVHAALQEAENSLIVGNKQLDALIAALRADRILNENFFLKMWKPDEELRADVTVMLRETISSTQERNRLLAPCEEGKKSSNDSIPCLDNAKFSPDGNKIMTTASQGKIAIVWDISGNLLRKLSHKNPIQSAEFSQDSNKIVTTASGDKIAKIWDISKKSPTDLLHENPVQSAELSPDGNKIVTTTKKKVVKVWDINGKCITLLEHDKSILLDDQKVNITLNEIISQEKIKAELFLDSNQNEDEDLINAQFHPDSNKIYTLANAELSRDNIFNRFKVLKVWDLEGTLIKEYDVWPLSWKSGGEIQFSPDRNYILTSTNKTAELWTLNGKSTKLQGHTGEITSLQFSPNGKFILTSSKIDHTSIVWNLEGKEIFKFTLDSIPLEEGTKNPVQNSTKNNGFVQFSPDSESIIITRAGIIKILNFKEQLLAADLKGHEDIITSIQFSNDGQKIVTTSQDKTARIWKIATQEEAQEEFNLEQFVKQKFKLRPINFGISQAYYSDSVFYSGQIYTARFNPKDSNFILISSFASWGRDGEGYQTRVWDRKQKKVVVYLKEDESKNARFSPDGKMIVTASDEGTVKLWNLQGELQKPIKAHQNAVKDVKFSPNSDMILTTSSSGEAKVWNLDGKLRLELKSTVQSAQFSPDGETIVTASDDGTVKLWNLQEQLLNTIKTDQSVVYNAQFSPNGEMIIGILDDNTAKVWNLKGKLLSKIEGHQGKINTAQFSPNSKMIITASDDATAKVWNLRGKLLSKIEGHQGKINTAQFGPNGKMIVTASDDGTAKVWKYDSTDKLVSQICDQIRGYLKENPNVKDSDRNLCDGVLESAKMNHEL